MKKICIIYFVIFSHSLIAQEIISLEQIKETLLSKNFGIQVAKNNLDIADNQATKRAVGYLPSLASSAGLNGNFGGTQQIFSDGKEANTSNAFAWGTSASIRVNHNFYDKLRHISLQQLLKSQTLADLQLKNTIQLSLLQAYQSYFLIAQLEQNVHLLTQNLNISEARLQRIQFQVELGQGNTIQMLNAQVDLQRDSINLLNAEVELDNEKRNLNTILGQTPNIDFKVVANLDLIQIPNFEILLNQYIEQNLDLKISKQNINISQVNINSVDAEIQPSLSSSLSYNYNFSDNPLGAFIDQSNSRGVQGDLTLNWNIFDGTRKIRKQNAHIAYQNQQIQFEQLNQQILSQLYTTWAAYENTNFIISVEQNSVDTNQENFDRTREKFNAGQLNSLDFRQAQTNLLNARVNLNNAKLQAIILTLQLQYLAGTLL